MGHLLFYATHLVYLQRQASEMEGGWTGQKGLSRSIVVSEHWVHAHTSSKCAHTSVHIHKQTHTHRKENTDKLPYYYCMIVFNLK